MVNGTNDLPQYKRKLIFNPNDSKDKDNAKILARRLISNYSNLNDDSKKSLYNLAKNKELSEIVAKNVVRYFEEIPSNDRIELLQTCMDSNLDANCWIIAKCMVKYFNSIPSEAEIILNRLASIESTAEEVIRAITYRDYELPSNLIVNLFAKSSNFELSANVLGYLFSEDYYKIDNELRIKLLIRLKDNEKLSYYIAKILESNFITIPRDVRNNILCNFIKREETISFAISIINKFYNEVSNETIDKLNTILDNEKILKKAIVPIIINYENLPKKTIDKLNTILDNEKILKKAIVPIIINYENLPIEIIKKIDKKNFDKSLFIIQNFKENIVTHKYNLDNFLNSFERNFLKLSIKIRFIIMKDLMEYNNKNIIYTLTSIFEKYREVIQKDMILKFIIGTLLKAGTDSTLDGSLPLNNLAYQFKPELRKFLFESEGILSDYSISEYDVGDIIIKKIYTLSKDIQIEVLNILLELTNTNKRSAMVTVEILQERYYDISARLRIETLLKLANSGYEGVYWKLAAILKKYEVPLDIKNQILEKIKKEDH
jgi:hypothetical protein